MHFRRHLLTLVSMIALCWHLSGQQSGRTITLDSRYFIQGYSNRAVAQVGLELTEATTLIPQLIYKPDSIVSKDLSEKKLFYSKKQWRYVGRGLSQFVGSIFLLQPFQFAYHEYGHGTRTAAIGYKPFYGHGSVGSVDDIRTAFRNGELFETFHGLYLGSLFETGGYTAALPSETLFPPMLDEIEENGWDLVIAGGGFNNEMYFSERIERQVQQYGGHVGYLIPYLNSKLSAQQYATGGGFFNDLNNIATYYQGQGYDISTDDLKNGSLTSMLASTMSYQVVFSMVKVLMGQPNDFQALSFKGVELPNTSFYMNREGLSYKFTTAYKTGNWSFPIALERVVKGDTRNEWTLGVGRRANAWAATVRSTVGKKFGLTSEVQYFPKDWLAITGGYALYQAENLRGQRLTPSLENGNAFHDVYVMVSVRY